MPGDLVVGEDAVPDVRRAIPVCDTAAILGLVAGEGAVVHVQRAVVVVDAATSVGRVIGEDAVVEGQRAVVVVHPAAVPGTSHPSVAHGDAVQGQVAAAIDHVEDAVNPVALRVAGLDDGSLCPGAVDDDFAGDVQVALGVGIFACASDGQGVGVNGESDDVGAAAGGTFATTGARGCVRIG